MLTLSVPGAGWLALTIIPIAILYFLRMRFRRTEVGSLYIWKTLVDETAGGKALRFRSLTLLALQAAAALLAAAAAAGPAFVERSLTRPGTAILIDVSASMAAVDETEAGTASAETARISRAAKAATLAKETLAALGRDEPAAVFACGAGLRELAEAGKDRGSAALALSKVRATDEGFSEAAVSDSLKAWLAGREEPWRAVLFTDGGLDLGGERIAAALEGNLRIVTVGSSGDSVGATGLRLDADERIGSRIARFSLWNGGSRPRELAATVDRDGAIVAAATIEAPPGWSISSIPIAGEALQGAYTLALDPGSKTLRDLQAPGSRAYLAVYPVRSLSVLLAGRDDPYLRAALSHEGIAYRWVAQIPDPLPLPAPDLVVADGVPVPANLGANLLAFGALPPDAPIRAGGAASGALATADPSHRLSRFVEWGGIRIEGGRSYARAPAARPPGGEDAGAPLAGSPLAGSPLAGAPQAIASAGGAIVIAAWERAGYKAVACGIDLARTGLGDSEAFPVFVRNVIDWTFPRVDEQSAYTLVVGERVGRAEPDSFSVEGGAVEIARPGGLARLVARRSGLSAWERGGARGYIAANPPAGELDIAPRPLSIGQAESKDALLSSTYAERTIPLAEAAIALCIALLAAEWILWRRSGKRRLGGSAAGR